MSDATEIPLGERRTAMIELNKRQGAFYDKPFRQNGNVFMKAWESARGVEERIRRDLKIDDDLYEMHWRWMADLSQKRVLDLGCHAGNRLSLKMAAQAKSYLGIDLSKTGIESLRADINKRGLINADARAVDFLSKDFSETGFDIVYAHSVIHHFRHFDVLLSSLSQCLLPGGIVITTDPLQTAFSARLVRAAYRPFQSDKDWEWPLTKKTFEQIQEHFIIRQVQGTLGMAKWAVPLALVSNNYALGLARRWHAKDTAEASKLGPGLWRCLHVTMCWEKP
jgi:2-polyprenyl-3-methyl-5-hydroxy-6-metoxy-1,4-benzoquinol methylase